jgi:hypothetical protein
VNRRIDFGGRDWAAHAQDHWLELAGNPNFPDYLRIVFVAYGRHRANGHARLRPGELAAYLVRKDATRPDRRNIRHSIDRAVDLGYLLPSSRMLCLVVSSGHVQGGIGDPDRRCDRDHTARANDVADVRPFDENDVSDVGPFPENDVPGQRRSVRGLSLFSSPATNPTGTRKQRTAS